MELTPLQRAAGTPIELKLSESAKNIINEEARWAVLADEPIEDGPYLRGTAEEMHYLVCYVIHKYPIAAPMMVVS